MPWPDFDVARFGSRDGLRGIVAHVPGVGNTYRIALIFGETFDHPVEWRFPYCVDLEVRPSDGPYRGPGPRPYYFHGNSSQRIAHLERGFKDPLSTFQYAVWLKHCLDVTGLDGIFAMNARSGGKRV